MRDFSRTLAHCAGASWERALFNRVPNLQHDPGVRSGPATIMVVDDETVLWMLIAEVLDDLGYTMLDAGDGPEALRILRAGAELDLLITDMGLPGGLDGRQVADAARAQRPGLKVLFITGQADGTPGDALSDPATQTLIKPFALRDLRAKVRSMLQ